MSRQRRRHSAAYKAKVALAAIKEGLTLAQIASRYEVHATQVRQWKSQALMSMESGFKRKHERDKKEQQAEFSSLYEQIGRLQMQLDWVKKKSGLDDV